MSLIIGFSFKLYGQIDTLNQSYFENLKKDLLKDSSIIDIKYVCETYSNKAIKTQHIYVKYKDDKINGYWRVGKCFHYYPNGKIELVSNIDISTKKYNGLTASIDQNGDTLETTIWENYKNKTMPPDVIYKIDTIGEIHELYPDKITEIKYKKGKRKSAITSIYIGDNTMTNLMEIYYNKDGSIDKIKDYSDQVSEIEKNNNK